MVGLDSEVKRRGMELMALYKEQLCMRERMRESLNQNDSDVFERIGAKDESMMQFKEKYDVWVQASEVTGSTFGTVLNALMHMAVRARDNDAFKFIADGADLNVRCPEDGETVLTWLCKTTSESEEHLHYVCQMLVQPQISSSKSNEQGQTCNEILESRTAEWWIKVVSTVASIGHQDASNLSDRRFR